IMSNVIQPWINSFGFGAMNDPHGDLINRILIGMIQDYVTGFQTQWRARGGDYPFGNLPAFSLPSLAGAPAAAPSQVNPVGSPTPAATSNLVQAPAAAAAPVVSTLTHDTIGQLVTPVGTFSSGLGGDYVFRPPGSQTPYQIALTPAHTGGF